MPLLYSIFFEVSTYPSQMTHEQLNCFVVRVDTKNQLITNPSRLLPGLLARSAPSHRTCNLVGHGALVQRDCVWELPVPLGVQHARAVQPALAPSVPLGFTSAQNGSSRRARHAQLAVPAY